MSERLDPAERSEKRDSFLTDVRALARCMAMSLYWLESENHPDFLTDDEYANWLARLSEAAEVRRRLEHLVLEASHTGG